MGMFDNIIAALGGSPDSSPPSSDASAVDMNARAGQLDVLGQEMSASSHVQFGIQARQAAAFQASQLRQNANSADASAQRSAADMDQQTQYITSRALAVAAASGGGASDPTVVNLIARDAGRGAYLKSVALYDGADKAKLDLEEADAKEYEGKSTLRNSLEVGAAGYLGARTSLLKSQARGASLMQRFGGDGPKVGAFAGVGVGDSGWGKDITGGGS